MPFFNKKKELQANKKKDLTKIFSMHFKEEELREIIKEILVFVTDINYIF